MRILVTGSRDWTDRDTLLRAFVAAQETYAVMGKDSHGHDVDWLMDDWRIVHGACPTGADAMADDWAIVNFVSQDRHPADWLRFGRAAGYRRNQEMVLAGADLCLAFVNRCRKHPNRPLHGSHGSMHTVRLAEMAHIPVWLFTDGWDS